MQDGNPQSQHQDANSVLGNQGNGSDQEIDDNPGPNQMFAVLPVPHHQEPHLMASLNGGL